MGLIRAILLITDSYEERQDKWIGKINMNLHRNVKEINFEVSYLWLPR